MKKIVHLICFSLLTLSALAQTAMISGFLKGAEGREIRLTKVTDWLTKEQQTIAKQTIQDDGSFSFTFELHQIEPVVLLVAFQKMELFAVPNFKHQLYGEKFVYDDRINPFIISQKLPLQFSKNDTLNRYIIEFDKVLEEYVYKNINQLHHIHDVNLLDSLYKIPENLSQNFQNFYEKYIYYTIGTEKINHLKARPLNFGKRYLNRQSPNSDDYCYMQFFNKYFENYFSNERGKISFRTCQNMILKEQPIDSLLNYLGQDPILLDEDLRELVCLKILQDNFSNFDLAKKTLQAFGDKTRFSSYKIISQQLLKNFNRLKSGTIAPKFALTQTDGTLVQSNDLKGKYLYIMFFKTNCTECLNEMEQMRPVYEKNKDFFEFVTIFLDDKKSDFISFTNSYKYPWKMLYAGNDYDFFQQWQTKSFPLQALISPDYKILEYPTVNVRNGIIQKIEKLSFEENRKKRHNRP